MRKVKMTTTDMLKTRWILVGFACEFPRIHITGDLTSTSIEVWLEDLVLGTITKRLIEENLMDKVTFECGNRKVSRIDLPKTRAAQVMELFQTKAERTNQELLNATGMTKADLSSLLRELKENELIIRKDWRTWIVNNYIEEETPVYVCNFLKDIEVLEEDATIRYLLTRERVSEEVLKEKFGITGECFQNWLERGHIEVSTEEFYETVRRPSFDSNSLEEKFWERLNNHKNIERVKQDIPYSKRSELNNFLDKMIWKGNIVKKQKRFYRIRTEDKILFFLYKHPRSKVFYISQGLLSNRQIVEKTLSSLIEQGSVKIIKGEEFTLRTI
ncbi:MAG: helix-turn-helix domain-containing protein [Clostridia bacterium]